MKKYKNNIVPITILVLCSLAFLLLSYLSYCRIDEFAVTLAAKELPVIVIDAGHGGEDGGTTGVSRVPEKEINLAISLKLQKMLEVSGFPVVMTRTSDEALGDQTLDTVKERKISDIHHRLEVAKEHKGCILISVHQNFFTSARYNGAQVFYSKNNEQSKFLSESIRSRVIELLQPENKRACKPAESSIYLLWNIKDPAVLVECGFLSNESDAKKLIEPKYQEQMAFAIYNGFLDFYQSREVSIP